MRTINLREKLYNTLLDEYGTNTPIFVNEITVENYSDSWTRNALSELCAEGSVSKAFRGVYYIPTQTRLGLSPLSPEKVLYNKYIYHKGETIGYYSDVVLLNQLCISTQVPGVIYITTNNTRGNKNVQTLGRQRYVLKKARVKVTSENVATLILLELVEAMRKHSIPFEENIPTIKSYIQSSSASKKSVLKYADSLNIKAVDELLKANILP